MPIRWRLALKAWGAMLYMSPSETQDGHNPHVRYTALSEAAAIGGEPRTVKTKEVWTLAEILMEPIFYNPNIGGWWGARITDSENWLINNRELYPQVRMIRGRSKERLLLAKNYYNLSKKISKAGVTHVAHIISGWGPGENIKLLDFKDLQKKYKDNTPFSRKQYNELIQHIPIKWKETLDNANKTKQNFPNCSLRAFLKKEVPKVGTWIQNTQGKIGLVETSKPCILHLFSGCADRPDGFAAYLKKNNFNCMEIDTKNNKNTQDLLNDNTYNKLIQLANEGYFVGALIGIPCGTFSVARIGAPENQPQQLRGRKLEEREGKPDNTRNQKREVLIANELIKRALAIAEIILNQKGNIIIENPIDRGDKNSCEKK